MAILSWYQHFEFAICAMQNWEWSNADMWSTPDFERAVKWFLYFHVAIVTIFLKKGVIKKALMPESM